MEWYRKTVKWVKSFADKKYANPALFGLCFLESSISPIPSDVLFVPLCISNPHKSFMIATWATFGSILGGALGFYIGDVLMDTIGYSIIEFYNAQEKWAAVTEQLGEFGSWFIAIASFTPIPYKFATIAAGAIPTINFWDFLILSIIGRAARYYMLGAGIFFLGKKFETFMDRYAVWIVVTFMVVFVLGFVAFEYLIQ